MIYLERPSGLRHGKYGLEYFGEKNELIENSAVFRNSVRQIQSKLHCALLPQGNKK